MSPPDLEAVLETPRLRLEPLQEAHAERLYAELQDERLYAFIPGRPPASLALLQERYRSLGSRLSADGGELWLNWAAFAPGLDAYVGTFQATVRGDLSAVIAYEVFPAYWRLGYAREACRRVLDLLFDGYRVDMVAALMDTRNAASRRLAERLGFKMTATRLKVEFFKGAFSDEHLYELRREDRSPGREGPPA